MSADQSPPFCRPPHARLHSDIKVTALEIKCGLNAYSVNVMSRLRDGVLDLSPNATFSIWSLPSLPSTDCDLTSSLFDGVRTFAAARGAETIRWRLPPDSWDPDLIAKLCQLNRSRGGSEIVDVNYEVQAHLWSPIHMSKGNRKRLKQAASLGARMLSVTDRKRMAECFALLARNRAARNLQLSMSFEQFEATKRVFPNDYELFALYFGDTLTASALVIKLSSTRHYVFMWGHEPDWSHRSPVVSLCSSLIEHALQCGAGTLDLGISSVDGVIDEGLAKFKSNLGAVAQPKRTLFIPVSGG